jgi:hypothetical protein
MTIRICYGWCGKRNTAQPRGSAKVIYYLCSCCSERMCYNVNKQTAVIWTLKQTLIGSSEVARLADLASIRSGSTCRLS